jgi:hypothetical protein
MLEPLSEDAEEPVYESLSNSSCGTDESLRRESSSKRCCSSTASTPTSVGMLAVEILSSNPGGVRTGIVSRFVLPKGSVD